MARLLLSIVLLGTLCRISPAEEPSVAERAAQELNLRAQVAIGRRNFAEAERLYRIVQEEYLGTRAYGVAVFNLGFALKEQGQLDEAIQQFLSIFPSRLSDQEPGSHIMELARNYRRRAAVQIAECYEQQGSHALAIDWLLQARDKYHDFSGCGNCMAASNRDIESRLHRVLRKTGNRRISIAIRTKLILEWRDAAPRLSSCRRLAEAAFGTSEQAELEAQIMTFCRQRMASKQRDERLQIDPAAPNDGHTLETRVILECLEILQNTKDSGPEWLWQQFLNQSRSACGVLMGMEEDSNPLQRERLLYISDQLRLHPNGNTFLRSQKNASDRELAFALVLLAPSGAIRNPNAIHPRLAAVSEDSRHGDEIADYLYALLLVDPISARSLRDRYARGPLAAYWRTAESTWHNFPRGFDTASQ